MRVLDIENIGRIGQMFIDGDLLKIVVADPLTYNEDDTNYNIPVFNTLKKALMKTERINPDIYLAGILWQCYPANKRMVAPAVVGKHLPGDWSSVPWMINDCPEAMTEAMCKDKITTIKREDGRKTCYVPIKASTGDVVGALELTEKEKPQYFESNYVE